MANYRDGYFDRGAPAGGVIGTAILVADGQAVSLDGISQLQITSDDTTAANRTFTVSPGTLLGQKVTLILESGSSTTCQLANSGNVKLTAAWEPVQYQALRLEWDGTYWVEEGRSNVTLPATTSLTSAYIFVGNGSNLATGVAVSGDITLSNAGVVAIGAGKVTVAMCNAAVMKEATGTLTQAQLLAISTPIEVIAAGGAGTIHIVDEVEMLHTYSTAQYATGSDLALEYGTTGDNITLIADTFVTEAASSNKIIKPSTYNLDGSTGTGAGFDVTANANKPVQWQASDFTNGNASNILKYRVRYHTVTLLT